MGDRFAPEDIWQCLEKVWVVTAGKEGVLLASSEYREAREAEKHLTKCREASTAKNCPAPNGNSAKKP